MLVSHRCRHVVRVVDEVEGDVFLDALSPAVAQVQDSVNCGLEIRARGVHRNAHRPLKH